MITAKEVIFIGVFLFHFN